MGNNEDSALISTICNLQAVIRQEGESMFFELPRGQRKGLWAADSAYYFLDFSKYDVQILPLGFLFDQYCKNRSL